MTLAALLSALFFLVAPVAGAAGLVPCVGGDACRACDIVKLMQNVMEFLIYASALIAVLVLVMVGFKMIIGQADGGELGSAAMSIVIGIIIMLLAWLVVDTGLKMLVKDPSYGPWNQIQCVANPVPQEYTGNPSGVGGGISGSCTPVSTGPCTPESLTQAGFDATTAQVMSGICNRESRGIPNVQPTTDKLWASGDGFSFGLFQINLVAHSIPCGGQTLNCPSAFRLVDSGCRTASWGRACGAAGFGYEIIPEKRPLYEQCKAAAQNPECNVAYARDLQKRVGYSPWYLSGSACGVR